MKSSIAERWGFVEVGKDENDRWEVVLENSVIHCRYGWKPINEDKGGESFITHLIIKENNQNQVGDEDSGGRIDAAAGRFEMLDASVKYDGTDFKTVQMSWKTQRPDFTAFQAVTIFPVRAAARIQSISSTVGTNGSATMCFTRRAITTLQTTPMWLSRRVCPAMRSQGRSIIMALLSWRSATRKPG